MPTQCADKAPSLCSIVPLTATAFAIGMMKSVRRSQGVATHIVGVLLALELHKAIALVLAGHAILWQVHVHHRATLYEELPDKLLRQLRMEPTRVPSHAAAAYSPQWMTT